MPEVINIGEELSKGGSGYLIDIVGQIIYFLRILAIILAVLFILYSGFIYFFSEKKQQEANRTIVYSLIGALISFLVFLIFVVVYDLILPSYFVDPILYEIAYNYWFKELNPENRIKYIQAVKDSCLKLAKDRNLLSLIGLPSINVCGRVVFGVKPDRPCFGWGVPISEIKNRTNLHYDCCPGLREELINGVYYCKR